MEGRRTKKSKRSELTKKDIIEILESDAFKSVLHAFAIQNKSEEKFRHLKFVGAMLTIVVACVGYYLSWDSNRKDRRNEQIQRSIDRKIEWMRATTAPVMDMRKTRALIKLACDHKKPMNRYEQDLKRLIALDKVVRNFTGAEFIFGSELSEQFLELTSFDESIKDICAPNAPSDWAWRQRFRNIRKLMGKAIQKDVQEQEEITKSFFNSLFH